MCAAKRDVTAFGQWVRSQPRGVLSRAQLATGLAYSTVHAAQFRLMRLDVALLLSRFTRGKVKAADIAKPRAEPEGLEKAAS